MSAALNPGCGYGRFVEGKITNQSAFRILKNWVWWKTAYAVRRAKAALSCG
jgi:hypothetical protein